MGFSPSLEEETEVETVEVTVEEETPISVSIPSPPPVTIPYEPPQKKELLRRRNIPRFSGDKT